LFEVDAMRINVREIIAGRRLSQERAELDISDVVRDNPAMLSASKAVAVLDAWGEGNYAAVTGRIACDAELVCSRCLTPFRHPLEVPFEEYFELDRTDGDEETEDDDGRLVHAVKTDVIDLDPYLKENIAVAVPAFPLCREDCRGLCPVCGADRNVKDCGCREKSGDPRWSALKDLLES
jgi:uncharacterized protein